MESLEIRDKIIEEYWLKQLGGDLPKLTLPTYKSVQNNKADEITHINCKVPVEVVSTIVKISRGSETGIFILMMTCITALLYKYTGCTDIIVGTTSSMTKKPVKNQLLFCRNQIYETLTLQEFNEQVKRTVIEMFRYQEYSYDKLFTKMSSLGNSDNEGIFNVAFIFEKIQTRADILNKFDMGFELSEKQDGMYLDISFHPVIYSEETISRFVENLFYIMSRLRQNLSKTIAELDSVCLKEKQEQIYSFNNTKTDFIENEGLLHKLFEEQVKKTPDDFAIICNNTKITYRQLNEKANRLARLLVDKGLKRNEIIGIFAEDNIETVIGTISILKAGGAYLPLDPEIGGDRLQFIYENSEVRLVLASRMEIPHVDFDGEHIFLHDMEYYAGDSNNLDTVNNPQDISYVIYTSGTTGLPKGVMIEHRSIVNQLLGLKRRYEFHQGLNHILMAPFTFDPSVQQIFLPLITGGRLFLIPKTKKMSANEYWDFVADNGIDIINTVPSLMEVLLDHERVNSLRFKFIILAGEVFSKDLYLRLKAKEISEKIINIYGPTEATINTTLYEIKEEEIGSFIPIGSPLDNYRLYILDKNKNLLPTGSIGELYIAGIGLARGYVNDDTLTQQKFVKCSITSQDERYYKSGDLVRWRSDGIVEFVGRADQQIKIRGMRVELGEIEAAMTSSPWVKEAVVIYHEKNDLTAYFTLKETCLRVEAEIDGFSKNIREYLKRRLPTYMVPGKIVYVSSLPITENGKVDRKALALTAKKPELMSEVKSTRNKVEEQIASIWKEVLGIEHVGINESFFDIGGNSLLIIKLQNKLNKLLGVDISVAKIFSYNTVSMLADYVRKEIGLKEIVDESGKDVSKLLSDNETDSDIAIVGMACRMPLAQNVNEFWENLCNGVDAVRSIPSRRMKELNKIANIECDDSNYYPQAAYIERIDLFDPAFFNIPPNEAKLIDPHQRMFMEVTWEALEDAGYTKKAIFGTKAGVFVASSRSQYANLIKTSEPSAIPGNLYSVIAGRISYTFNLKGPSQMVDTACSSSLVAVHNACQSIKAGDCDMAIAGGINLYLTTMDKKLYEVGIASPDGRSKTFDESANGTGGGEGVGVIILKPLRKALEDNDNIYAVIKGSTINSDGKSNGITAPNAVAQAALIKEAWVKYNIDPQSVSYIEVHGTGTKLGDPIEIEGITEAFKAFTNRKQFCSIGSVKTNIGHLDSAAGIAGLIKTTLMLKHKIIPPTLHFKNPNTHIDFCNTPVYVNSVLNQWEPECGIRRAGVSSFGLSGTNCHTILEEYCTSEKGVKQPDQDETDMKECIFTLTAKSEKTLYKVASHYASFLKECEHSFKDVCFTSNIGRDHYIYKLAIIASSMEELVRKLELLNSYNDKTNTVDVKSIQGVFISSPSGEPPIGTVLPSDNSLESLAESFIRGDAINWNEFYRKAERKKVSLPVYFFEHRSYWAESDPISQEENIRPAVIEPKIRDIIKSTFSLGVHLLERVNFSDIPSMCKSLEDFSCRLVLDIFNQWGIFINPSERFSISNIIFTSGVEPKYKRLIEYLLVLLERNGVIEVDNGNMQFSESYYKGDIDSLYNTLLERYPDFQGSFKIVKYCVENYPRVLTGKVSSLSILFPDGTPAFLQTFTNKGCTMGDCYEFLAIEALKNHINAFGDRKVRILEVGAGAGTVAKQIFSNIQDKNIEYFYTDIGKSVLSNAQKQFEEYKFVNYKIFDIEKDPLEQGFYEGEFDIVVALNVIHATRIINNSLENLKKVMAKNGSLYIIEKVVNEPQENLVWGLTDGWWLFEDETRVHSPLMGIQQWKSCINKAGYKNIGVFPEGADEQNGAVTSLFIADNSKDEMDYRDYMYRVNWVEKDLNMEAHEVNNGVWLIFCEKSGVSSHLIYRLEQKGCSCIRVESGDCYNKLDDEYYVINAANKLDYDRLIDSLDSRIVNLKGIIHLWTYGSFNDSDLSLSIIEKGQQLGALSLFYITKALFEHNVDQLMDLRIVSSFAYHLEEDRFLCPEKAPLHGIAKVISQENSKFQCYSIDLDPERLSIDEIAETIIGEMETNKTDYTVVYRKRRFVQELDRLYGNGCALRETYIRENGVYIITGGAGKLGLEICKYITEQARVKLIIINRSILPDKSSWRNIVTEGCPEHLHRKIKAFVEMEESGSQVDYYSADITDEDSMILIFETISKKYGNINGIVHCAAASGDMSKLIKLQSIGDFQKVLSPKLKGTVILDSLTKDQKMDFFVVFSSIASLWGGASGADYAAANAFLDSFSAYRNSKGKPTISINWYAWEGLTDPGCIGYMNVADATKAFAEALKCCLEQIVIGKFDMKTLHEWSPMLKIQISDNIFGIIKEKKYTFIEDEERILKEANILPRLKGRPEGEEYTQLEKEIAAIWSEVLGYMEIDIHENFFGIGGDSLSVLKVLKLINEKVDESIEVGDLFSYTSVSGLTQFLENRRGTSVEDPLMNLIKSVKDKKISVDHAMKGYEIHE